MYYVSTRGGSRPLPFTDAVLAGLAPDGGLLLPETFPCIRHRLSAWQGLSYTELAQALFRLYVDDIPGQRLDAIVADAFGAFEHPDVAPLVRVGERQLLELFHGPTLSFKDIALQVLGRLFEHVLGTRGGRLNIVGATSGDTGSAAIAGVRGRPGMSIFMLYPAGRTSALQELQMTTVTDANVHCLAIDGSFDDCQAIVKALLGDPALKRRHCLGAVNSINWARVLAQMSYYAYAALKSPAPPVFVVPTGNFGNIFAGLAVREMGVPIAGFVLATNDNDILARFFQTGVYQRGKVRQTLSPSMDIQVASNFERFVHLRLGRDPARTRAFMAAFAETGQASLADDAAPAADIEAVAIDNATTLATMRAFHVDYGYLPDPHTAVGIAAAERLARGRDAPTICLAAAHPAKFPQAVARAIGEAGVAVHPTLAALAGAPCRRTELPAERQAVLRYIRSHAG